MASSAFAALFWYISVSTASQVGFRNLIPSPILPPVYPETMGVPLEEMDAVFGEGMGQFFWVYRPDVYNCIFRGAGGILRK
jgi:hypothetical protein